MTLSIGILYTGWLVLHEEFADEEAYYSIFVERFHNVLFHVVGAEPGAN
jgi:hypothetical protein